MWVTYLNATLMAARQAASSAPKRMAASRCPNISSCMLASACAHSRRRLRSVNELKILECETHSKTNLRSFYAVCSHHRLSRCWTAVRRVHTPSKKKTAAIAGWDHLTTLPTWHTKAAPGSLSTRYSNGFMSGYAQKAFLSEPRCEVEGALPGRQTPRAASGASPVLGCCTHHRRHGSCNIPGAARICSRRYRASPLYALGLPLPSPSGTVVLLTSLVKDNC